MERNRAIGMGLIAGGIIVLLAGALADVIGYGGSGVGAKQITVIVVGAVVFLIGVITYQRSARS